MKFIMIVLGLLLDIALFILYAAIGTWLWNMLMPAIFGLSIINFWQMYGLIWLSRFFFYHPNLDMKVDD
jgi:hypothetical protein